MHVFYTKATIQNTNLCITLTFVIFRFKIVAIDYWFRMSQFSKGSFRFVLRATTVTEHHLSPWSTASTFLCNFLVRKFQKMPNCMESMLIILRDNNTGISYQTNVWLEVCYDWMYCYLLGSIECLYLVLVFYIYSWRSPLLAKCLQLEADFLFD